MNSLKVSLPLALLLASAPSMHAQMPNDNQTWKARCETLAAVQATIDAGAMTPKLVATTHGIPGSDFTMLALDRAHGEQHAVACTLFYMAAIAERNGNGGHGVDSLAAENRAILAHAEFLKLHNQPVPMSASLRLTGVEARHLLVPTPNEDQVRAVLTAATTMPLTASR